MSAKTRVRSYRWKKGGEATPGAMLSAGDRQLFIPMRELTDVADALVDLAERLELGRE